jgi:hypothetical protein
VEIVKTKKIILINKFRYSQRNILYKLFGLNLNFNFSTLKFIISAPLVEFEKIGFQPLYFKMRKIFPPILIEFEFISVCHNINKNTINKVNPNKIKISGF